MAKNIISIPQGNSIDIIIEPIVNETVYTLSTNDKVYFTVKSHGGVTPKAYISKILTLDNYVSGKLTLHLSPTDTDLEPYEYCFDCALQYVNANNEIEFKTFIKADESDFIVTVANSEVVTDGEIIG